MYKKTTSHAIVSFIVALSFFMEAIDSTVLNTALPAMSHSLHVDPVDLKVALISYLLSLAIFIPISGWLADKFGEKKIFIGALMLFTLSSLACGFAQSLTELVIGRFIQGFGGALGLPVGRLILIRTFGRERFIKTMTHVVMVGALGMMLGPVVGGVITHYFSWHWIFWLNIPVGVLAIILAFQYLHMVKPEPVPALDKLGFALFGSSLAGLTFGLSALSETIIRPSAAIIILLLSTLLLITYALHSTRSQHPIVKTDLLRFRTFQIAVTGNLLSRLGFGGIPFLIPLLLQINLGYSAQLSGLLLAPTAMGILIGKSFVLAILRKFGYKRVLIINTLCAGCAILTFIRIDAQTSPYMIACLTLIYGVTLTLQYSAINSLAYADLSSGDLSAANSIMSTLQQLAQSFGVAVSALLIRLFSSLLSTPLTLTLSVFHFTFCAIGLFTLGSSLIFIRLKDNDGHQMIKFQMKREE